MQWVLMGHNPQESSENTISYQINPETSFQKVKIYILNTKDSKKRSGTERTKDLKMGSGIPSGQHRLAIHVRRRGFTQRKPIKKGRCCYHCSTYPPGKTYPFRKQRV